MNRYFTWTTITLSIVFLLGLVAVAGNINRIDRQISAIQSDTPRFGDINSVAGKTYFLYGSGVSSSATSITLTSFTQPTSNYRFSMSNDFGTEGYLTLEPGNATRQEFVKFTGITYNSDSTATLTGVTRGLAPVSPYTASSTLQKAHPGGSQAVLSNPPQLYELFANKNNTQYITGAWGFQGTAPTSTTCATANELCSKTYVDALANQGAATSTESVGGIVELATQLEMASSTDLGADIPLVLQAKYATSSPSSVCGLCAVITGNAGKIAQGFIDLTEAFSWSGLHTFSAGFLSTASSTVAAPLTITGDTALSAGILSIATTTATSTISGNLTVALNASTTNLTISGTCTGCISYTASSTAFNVSGTTVFTGSIPSTAQFGYIKWFVNDDQTTGDAKGFAMIARSGITSVTVSGFNDASGSQPEYTFSWSGNNFTVTEDVDDTTSVEGTVYWYK